MSNDDMQTKLLAEGTLLQDGKYRVGRSIASGGFGNTYIVTNMAFDERMALKEFFIKGISVRNDDNTTVSITNTINKEQFDTLKDKFKKEARRLRKLNNPHIVKVHDLFEENGTAYYAMELIDGESLASRLSRTGQPLTEKQVFQVLHQLMDALEEVHAMGIWHLDLKPGNILVDKKGRAVLIDFGASKQLSASEGYTTTTSMCYTPGYAPTEQIEQVIDRIGPWTDIYALGATLYNLVTNRPPLSASDIQDDEPFVYPYPVSDRLQYLIKWMMQLNRSQRPQSIAQIRQYLAQPPIPGNTAASDKATVFIPPKSQHPQPASSAVAEASLPSRTGYLKWIGLTAVGLLLLVGAYFLLAPKGTHDNSQKMSVDTESNELVTEAGKSDAHQAYQTVDYESKLGPCAYSGPVDGDGQPHGMGVAQFTDGRQYQGPFEHGNMSGKGAYFQYSNGDVFQGEFKDNAFYQGRYTIKEDGSYFEGTFFDGQPQKGQWYDKNGKKL